MFVASMRMRHSVAAAHDVESAKAAWFQVRLDQVLMRFHISFKNVFDVSVNRRIKSEGDELCCFRDWFNVVVEVVELELAQMRPHGR